MRKDFRVPAAAGLAGLGLLQLLLYFNQPGHFFQGDTLYWLSHRYTSLSAFFNGFFELDPGGWYRPLTQRTVQSLLYPLAGLNPIPYRIVTAALFIACTVSVFVLVDRLAERRRAAWFGTIFFATHVTHAYTTYDVAFTPELLYSLLYVCSAVAFLSYLRTGSRASMVASLALFAGSLLSKEAAVTLPVTLALIWFFERRRGIGMLSLAPHFVILTVYFVFAVGYLQVGGVDIGRLLSDPVRAGAPGYQLVLGSNLAESGESAFRWAFNIPDGPQGLWPRPEPWLFMFLKLFRIVVFAGAAVALMTPQRSGVFIGVLWFVVAAAPMLPLLDHFLPYYLFAPLAGLALAIGVSFDELYGTLSARFPGPAKVAFSLLFAVVISLNAGAISEAAREQGILGASAGRSQTAMNEVKALRPALPKGAILVILNEEQEGVWWDHAEGGLFQMAYNDPSMRVEYSMQNVTATEADLASGRAVVFKLSGGRLHDVTAHAIKQPEMLRSKTLSTPE